MTDLFHPVFALKRALLYDNFKKAGIVFTESSGYRGYEKQFRMKYIDKNVNAVAPEESFHTKGRAVDIVFRTETDKAKASSIGQNMGLKVVSYTSSPHLHFDDRYDIVNYYRAVYYGVQAKQEQSSFLAKVFNNLPLELAKGFLMFSLFRWGWKKLEGGSKWKILEKNLKSK